MKFRRIAHARRTHVRRAALGAALAVTLVSAAACGGSSDSADDGGDSSYTIGIVQFSASDETTEKAINAYVDYADKEGWKTSKVDPQGSVDKAISAMNDYVQKNVDLIIVAVFPSDSLTAGVRAATAAGIPVMSFSGGTAEGVTISADAGRPNSKEVSAKLVSDLGGTGDLLVLGYKSGLPCLGREQELDDQLKDTTIKVTRNEVPIPGQVEGGTQFTQAWLAKHPEGSGNLAIWGCFDDPALGAISALRQAGRTDVKVYGINGTPAAVKAVQDGDMTATAFLDVVAAGTQLAEKTPEVIKAGPDADPQDLPIPTFLVTKDSYADFAAKYPDDAK